MIKYEIILEAKLGNEEAIEHILKFYEKKIKKICNEDDFVQEALFRVFKGIKRFKNIKK